MEEKQPISADNLPLSVREHLMRGHQQQAIALLETEYGMDKVAAEEIIEDYRAALRERKIALDIQIMNEQNAKESNEHMQTMVTWGARIVLFVFAIAVLYLVTGTSTP